ncbi:hypothetical protein RvY_05669 [Ramazzottius varieornatus]|uniref:Secreted protein n=1 Tax=Ramazzottius varieornatus TaxID=947166 RepID=A0A1D1V4T8_RAMVA|nr:hypothetical protein RvY_05669 [Ramazzottius varieornatus]
MGNDDTGLPCLLSLLWAAEPAVSAACPLLDWKGTTWLNSELPLALLARTFMYTGVPGVRRTKMSWFSSPGAVSTCHRSSAAYGSAKTEYYSPIILLQVRSFEQKFACPEQPDTRLPGTRECKAHYSP